MLVCVFLRGAADGLSLVVPHGDDRYHSLRPTLAIARPDDARAKKEDRVIDLDGHFGLHPSLAALAPLYRSKSLAIVHATGSDDQTRSHFEAQDRMEHAGPKDQPLGSGWLARHLQSRPGKKAGSLAAVALGTSVPEALRGVPVAVLQSASDYRLGPERDDAFAATLASLYAAEPAGLPFDRELGEAGAEALATLERLRALDAEGAPRVKYPTGQLGRGLSEIARLARADLGVEVACVDYDGWDTHFVAAQLVPGLAKELGDALSAFSDDLGEAMSRVTVVCMTEFGRRAYENASLGTDHGRGGAMFLLGGGVRGGRVVTDWPGLEEHDLEPPGDLRVTIDYRDVLSELVRSRLGNPRVADVFPGWDAKDRGVFG
jgi:uncharacterized protein (DUF1501 family)